MGRSASAPKHTDRELKDRAHALVLKGKFAQAVEVYRGLVVANARDPNIRMRHAELCRKVGQIDEAVASYLAAAQLLEREGHVARARAVLTTALQLAPGEPSLLAPLRRITDAQRQSPSKLKQPALSLVPPPVPSTPGRPSLPPAKKLPPHASTTPARPRLRLAYSLAEEDISETPTDPYCPLFDWIDEAPKTPAPKPPRPPRVPAYPAPRARKRRY